MVMMPLRYAGTVQIVGDGYNHGTCQKVAEMCCVTRSICVFRVLYKNQYFD